MFPQVDKAPVTWLVLQNVPCLWSHSTDI